MKKTSRRVISTSIFLFIFLISIYLFLHSSFFYVDKIYVSGNLNVTEEEIMALSSLHKGDNIFKINNELSSKSIEFHPMIKEAKLQRHLPRSIEIIVSEREVWGVIPNGDVVWFIDDEGVLLDKASNVQIIDYPIITMDEIPDRITLGQVIDPNMVEIIKPLWDEIKPDTREQISQFHYKNIENSVIVYTIKGTEVRFGDLERFEDKVKLFEQIFNFEQQLIVEGKDVLEYVDLRYKGQPIVRTKF